MRILARSLLCGALLAVSAASLADQTASPFVGIWKLNTARSQFNPGPPPHEVVRTYRQDGDLITMTINGTRANGEVIAARAQFRLDGKEYGYTGTSPLDTVSVTATDAHTWVGVARKKGHFLSRSTFTVSADGHTLTQKIKGVHSNGKPVDDVQVYERQ
jgi:hypothetical protein